MFFFRVKRAMDKVTLTVSQGSVQVESRRLTYLRPPEMIRYELSEKAWADLRRNPGPISIAVEAADGP